MGNCIQRSKHGNNQPGRITRRSEIKDTVINSIERRVKARNRSYPSSPEEIYFRIAEIRDIQAKISDKFSDWIPHSDGSLNYFVLYEASGYKTLPFPGGAVDQPEWIMQDFSAFIEISELYELQCEIEELLRRNK